MGRPPRRRVKWMDQLLRAAGTAYVGVDRQQTGGQTDRQTDRQTAVSYIITRPLSDSSVSMQEVSVIRVPGISSHLPIHISRMGGLDNELQIGIIRKTPRV